VTGRVVRSPQALLDVAGIAEYISRQSGTSEYARQLVEELDESFERYARQPLMGELREDLGPDVRTFAFRKNYIVLYRPLEDGIDVLRVFHTARDYPRLFHGGP
jgi:toxin ParE1/3/4